MTLELCQSHKNIISSSKYVMIIKIYSHTRFNEDKNTMLKLTLTVELYMRSSLYPVGSVCMLNLTSEGLSPYCSVNQIIHVLGRAKHWFLILFSFNPLPHRDAF